MDGRGLGWLVCFLTILLAAILVPAALFGQEIPLGHCDSLPTIHVSIAGQQARFLVDTAATSVLNLEAFPQGTARDIRVTSWRGTLATSAKEVTLAELGVGQTKILRLTLPAIGLSAIGKACGEKIDGILGADLLGRLGATIDLKRELLHVTTVEERRDQEFVSEIEGYTARCANAFNDSNESTFEDCLDPNIVMFTADGEFHGREKVLGYIRDNYLHQSPAARLEIHTSPFHTMADTVRLEYEFSVESRRGRLHVAGIAMCRKSDGRWRVAGLQDSLVESDPADASGFR